MAGTVLVVGASGNIGVSVILAALRRKLNVLAVVRTQDAADKMFKHVGSKDGITVALADPTNENDVQAVVEGVKDGKLPAFQHVFVSVGQWGPVDPLSKLATKGFKQAMNVAVESTFCECSFESLAPRIDRLLRSIHHTVNQLLFL
jgi:NAD(P)-dependent dehydrogenase (short-subunit alcohol dehydrogenase family)